MLGQEIEGIPLSFNHFLRGLDRWSYGISALITAYFRERMRLTVSYESVLSTAKVRGRGPGPWYSQCPTDIPRHMYLATEAPTRLWRHLMESKSKGDREQEEWEGLIPFWERLLRREGRVELSERRRQTQTPGAPEAVRRRQSRTPRIGHQSILAWN